MIRKLIPSTRDDSSIGDTSAEFYVLGGGHVGASLAHYLQHQGRSVVHVDESGASSAVPRHRGDPSDVATLEDAGVSDGSTVVVASPSDTRNLLIAQHVNARFDAERVVVLGNDPETLEVFENAGHEPICATTALVETVVEAL